MAAAQAGDRAALEALLRSHYDRLYAVCRRLTGQDADAADACQEALVAIVRGLPRFDARSSFGTWAYRIATNAALDELRRRRRRPDPGLPEGAERFPGAGSAVADATATRLDVDAALASLSPEFRAAVVLRDLCGFSYEEIGEVLEIPPGTVRSRIARARAALVPLLTEPGEDRNRPPTGRRPTERR